MRIHFRLYAAITLVGATLSVFNASAQSIDSRVVNKYKVYDVGTLGGNFSGFFNVDFDGGDFTPSALNRNGELAGIALETSGNAGSFIWNKGKLKQLPSLRHANEGGGGSNTLGINDSGFVIGISNNGQVSSFNNKLYNHAVSWAHGKIHNLGDLGGHDADANFVNDSGLIVGFAFNSIPDKYGYYGTQLHATTWRNDKIRDLGTLGGTDSEGWVANNKGQVIGIAFLDTDPKPPFNQPQDDAFLWFDGTMTDLGTLGGSFSTPSAINPSGQVTVISLDSTNSFYQSYLWDGGAKTVLNSAGGNFVYALTLNQSASIVGWNTDSTDTNVLATEWSPNGQGQLLGTVGNDTGSIALGINDHGVVVGGSGSITLSGTTYTHAFVWQNGKMRDLNTLIPAGSPLTLNVAYDINQDGVIAGSGTNSAGDTHAFILVPDSRDSEEFTNAASAPVAPGSSIKVSSPLERITRAARSLGNSR
jgi:probable HAF family extracellular repeat protein